MLDAGEDTKRNPTRLPSESLQSTIGAYRLWRENLDVIKLPPPTPQKKKERKKSERNRKKQTEVY